MPIIKITDTDFTTPGGAAFDYDIAYVPGFSDKVGCPTEPTLCRTVYEFENNFGTKPVQFTSNQYISKPEIWSDNANYGITTSEDETQILIMPANSYDIAYMYAKELIASGIAVYYHAIGNNSSFTLLTTKPDDWSTLYSSYYEKIENDYIKVQPVKSVITSEDIAIINLTGKTWPTNIYQAVDSDFTDDEADTNEPTGYKHITERPVGWANIAADGSYYAFEAPIYEADKYYEGTAALDSFYANLKTGLQEITAVNEYNIKYITSGGYPTLEINNSPAQAMIDCASQIAAGTINAGRGDCIALIDNIPCYSRDYSDIFDILNDQGNVTFTNGQYAAAFVDWAYYNRNTTDFTTYVNNNSTSSLYDDTFKSTTKIPVNYTKSGIDDEPIPTDSHFNYKAGFPFPGSFAYLKCVANQLSTGNSWLAVAGVQRGIVNNYVKNYNSNVLTNKIADFVLQDREEGISFNPITYINGYGNCIWGNRTLFAAPGNLVASNFLNIRSMLCDLKKVCYRAAKRNTFEQDSEILWINFTQPIKALLEQMRTAYCISSFKITRRTDVKENAKLGCTIKIYPLYAIEDFDIDIELYDSEVTVSE